ncbi:amidohydrolase [Nocardiopsis ansamitocini]|uniref:Peptidase M20 dimerisation domain-containing protein n=1 Tax=Nocardiopsis ansamitocini TaxID=1670832 RepID=A0A9W6PBA0_9ACTN|nr:amidohydrolase [Nocardiopsis ansamitocini]GLU50361.1 hypothetical protein Nans01_47120 [Nocardiopsis ansamitocini]
MKAVAAVPQAVDPQRVAEHGGEVMRLVDEIFPLVEGFYVDLHRNPELSHQENRTARAVAEWLSRAGFEVETNIGGTGVVGVLRNGDGPTVLLRGDMDALPIEEQTDLPYASTARGVDADGQDVPIMHACGHDAHTACLVGTADLLASSRDNWRGTLMIVAQPGEETLDGAEGMLQDGLYERFGRPDIALGQHVGPQPAGMIVHRAGVILASSATYRVRIFGQGGHGSQPHTTIDPVVIAATIVTRLQAIVAREINPSEMAVITVGVLRAGSKANVIPDEAYLEIDTRALNNKVAEQLRASIERVITGEARAANAPRDPEITLTHSGGVTRNDPGHTRALSAAHRAYFGDAYVVDMPEPFTATEDFGRFGLPDDPNPIPYVFWFVGATPHEVWAAAPGTTPFDKITGVPGSHSARFAPDREPTLRAGLAALTLGALSYLAAPTTEDDSDDPHAFVPTAWSETEAAAPAADDWDDENPVESTQNADMDALLGDDEDEGESTQSAGPEDFFDDPPPPMRGPTQGTQTGPSDSFRPPSGPAYYAPPPSGSPIQAPPPLPGTDPDDYRI